MKFSLLAITFYLSILGISFANAQLDLHSFHNKWSGSVEYSDEKISISNIAEVGPSFVETSFDKGVNFLNKFIFLQMKVNDVAKLSGIEVRITSDEFGYENFTSIELPLYTDPEFNVVQNNEWFNYSFTLGESKLKGKVDLNKIKRIGFYIQSKNSRKFFPLKVELRNIKLVDSIGRGRVSFTFDDSYKEHFDIAEIMYKYSMIGTAYVMTNEIGQEGYLTKDELSTMKYVYGWEIGSHHAKPFTLMSDLEMLDELKSSFNFLKDLGIDEDPFHFAYPLGKQSHRHTLPIIQWKLKTARIAGGGAETLPPANWHLLRAFNVTPEMTAEKIMKRIEVARQNNEWLILMFHKFVEDNPKDDLTYSKKEFIKLCEMIFKNGVQTWPINKVYEEFKDEKLID